jgi:hypothetical protein
MDGGRFGSESEDNRFQEQTGRADLSPPPVDPFGIALVGLDGLLLLNRKVQTQEY